MAARDHLGTQFSGSGPFYHGTDAELQPGDHIRSAHSLGLTNAISGGAMGSTRNTYFTNDPQTAFDYAGDAHMRNGGRESFNPGKLHVYEVAPVSKYTTDSVQEDGFKSRGRLRVTGVYSRGVDGPGSFYGRQYG